MKKTRFQRITAFALAMVLLICGSAVSIGASPASGENSITEEIREMLNAESYSEYLAGKNQIGVAQKDTHGDVVVSATENAVFEVEGTATPITKTAKDSQTAHLETADGKTGLYLPSLGKVTWTTNGFAGRDPLFPQTHSGLQAPLLRSGNNVPSLARGTSLRKGNSSSLLEKCNTYAEFQFSL